MFPFLDLRRTNTVKVVWRISNLTGGEIPQLPLRVLFQSRAGTRIGPPMFRKLTGQLPKERLQSPWRDSNPQRWGCFYYQNILNIVYLNVVLYEHSCLTFIYWLTWHLKEPIGKKIKTYLLPQNFEIMLEPLL